MLTAIDEQVHPGALPHRYWNESFYFNFLSSDGAWGGATRIGISPNQGQKDAFIIFYFPDGKAGFIRCLEKGEGLASANTPTAVEGIRYRCVEPFKRWKVNYKGPVFVFDDPADAANFHKITLNALPTRQVKLDLDFDAYHAPFDFHDAMKIRLLPFSRLLAKMHPAYLVKHFALGMFKLSQMRVMGGASHYEQAGHVSGTVTIDGKEHRFQGTGQRDHSWGVRDMRVINNWQWFSCQFGEDLAFNVTRVELLGFAAVGGHAYYQGECRPLKKMALNVDYDPSGRWAKQLTLKIDVGTGAPLELKATALHNLPVTVTTEGLSSCVNEALARFEWNGRSSTGISEFMGQVYP